MMRPTRRLFNLTPVYSELKLARRAARGLGLTPRTVIARLDRAIQ
jgi:hypothetical protein